MVGAKTGIAARTDNIRLSDPRTLDRQYNDTIPRVQYTFVTDSL